MKLKKNPKADLENHNKLFFLLGTILALILVYIVIEWKAYERPVAELSASNFTMDEEIDVPVTSNIKEVLPPPPKINIPKIDVIENEKEVEEAIFTSTEVNEDERIEINDIVEDVEDPEEDDDVSFVIVEEAPTFPGCSGTKDEKKRCFQENIQKIIRKYYNTGLANDLGLAPGKKRVYVQFKIDKHGNITDLKARGPHKRLEKEAIQVMGKIPKLVPGKQRNRPVGVIFNLPITLVVE